MYKCEKHGKLDSDCCEECQEIYNCDCSELTETRFKDLIIDCEDGKITVEYWLKNNIEWYQPQKDVDLSTYDNVELLSTSYYGDLFYAYNNGDKENGRLFRGRWNKGIR